VAHYYDDDDDRGCGGDAIESEHDRGCGGDDWCDAIAPEPDCVEGLDHEWHWHGGCDSNPGVWSLGGTTLLFVSRCRYCGATRRVTAYGWQRPPDQCDQVRYVAGAPDVAAVRDELRRRQQAERDELRRRRRNGLARQRREALAVEVYGSVARWREALRARRAAVLRRTLAAVRR